MSNIIVRGKVFGKESSVTTADSLRAILPPAVMQVLDATLNYFFEQHLTLPGVWAYQKVELDSQIF